MKYAIVIPAKNEESTIEVTLDSIFSQTVLPEICLVVDDDSTDNTASLVLEKKKDYPLIQYIKIQGKKTYQLGAHVIEVFNRGKEYIDSIGIKYDYIIKLDADLSFESNVMESFLPYTSKNYGIISGTPYYLEEQKKIYDRSPEFHSRGQFKVYSKKCLDDIGGVPLGLGWDTADNIKAMKKGWKTMRVDDIEYMMQRKIGGKYNLKKGRIKHGIGAYNLRYDIIYLLFRVIHDLFKPPIVLGAFYFLSGYISSIYKRNERILTKEESKLLRSLLWSSLTNRFKKGDFYLAQKIKG